MRPSLIGFLLLLAPLSARSGATHLVSSHAEIAGNRVLVHVLAADDDYANDAIAAVLMDVENTLAIFGEQDFKTEVARINREAAAGPIEVTEEVLGVLRRATTVSRVTGNAFALTLAPVTRLWGFADGETPHVPSAAEIEPVLRLVDDSQLDIDNNAHTVRLASRGVAVEYSSVLRGYAVDRALALLHNRGFSNALVAVQGDVGTLGRKVDGPWAVGIQDPRARGFFAVLALRDRVTSTVGDYQRFFEVDGKRFHDVLDPRTGQPGRLCRSVTVIAPDGVTASAFARAVFVLGPDAGMQLIEERDDLDAVIVSADNTVTASSRLKDIQLIRPPTE